MSNEIATYSMILSKLSLGKSGTECPTKTQILAINSLIIIDNASTYGANECVKIDDIRKKAETWNYYLTVSPTSMSFGAGGGSKSFTVSSYKRKVLDGVEQSGDTSVSLKSTTISGTGFSLSGTTVSASANEITSNRTGTVTITQNESNKTVTISLLQYGNDPDVWEYHFSVNPYKVSVDASGGSGSVTITSYESLNGAYYQDIDYNIDSSTLPSWATFNKSTSTFTISANSSTSSRSAKVYFQQNYSGNRDYASLSQSGATPTPDTYVFKWNDNMGGGDTVEYLGMSSGQERIDQTLTSTKNGSNVGWSLSGVPSWITGITTSGSEIHAIVAANTSTSSRSANITLTQSGSGKTLYIKVSQAAHEDTYSWQIKKSSEPNEDAYWRQTITYDVPAKTIGFSGGYSLKGRKNGEKFASYTMSSDSPSWLLINSDGNGYTVLHNTGSTPRSGTLTLTQAESGLKCYIEINQAGYTPTYTFNVTPTNLSVTAAETNETLTVQSYKTVLKSNGSETTESLDYEFSSNNSWVAAARTTTNTTYVTVAENETTTQRTAKITLTQAESGAQAFVNVIQDGKQEVANRLTLTSLTYSIAYLFPLGEVPVEGSTMYLAFQVPNTSTWDTNNGLTINRGTIYAGNIANIYVHSGNGYTLVKSFQLQTGEQTVHF